MGRANRRDKFVELAEKRVARVIKDLRLLGNLANKTNYSYDQEDVRQIISTLGRELRNLKKRFLAVSESTEVIFQLRRPPDRWTKVLPLSSSEYDKVFMKGFLYAQIKLKIYHRL